MWRDIQKFKDQTPDEGHRVCWKGGSSQSSTTTGPTTINTDSRAVLQDAVQLGAGASANINMSSADAEVLKTLANSMPDAVKALGQMGATVIKDAGGAVVDLNRDSIAANTKTWDATVSKSAEIIDSLIDGMSQSYTLAKDSINTGNKLAEAAVASFTPTENKNADIGKYAMFAAAAVAAAVLLKDK